jgi:hypothetical protein
VGASCVLPGSWPHAPLELTFELGQLRLVVGLVVGARAIIRKTGALVSYDDTVSEQVVGRLWWGLSRGEGRGPWAAC